MQDSGTVTYLAGSDPCEGAQYAASSARFGASLWSWLTMSAPARRMRGVGVDYVRACPSVGELRNLTYHDRTIRTERQRARPTMSAPQALIPTRRNGHRPTQAPHAATPSAKHHSCMQMRACVEARTSVSLECAPYPARASHACTSSRLRRHLAQVCAECPLHAQGAGQSPPVRQDARWTVKFPTETGYRPRPTGASRWTPWWAPAHP